jgi:hypothetical protein
MNRRIWSTVISAIFLIASSACSKNRAAPQVIVEIPSGFTGNFLLEMGVRDAPPWRSVGKHMCCPCPGTGRSSRRLC